MKIKKAKGIQHSVEGYVCACLMSGCFCETHYCICACSGIANPYDNDSGAADTVINNHYTHSSADSVQNGLER